MRNTHGRVQPPVRTTHQLSHGTSGSLRYSRVGLRGVSDPTHDGFPLSFRPRSPRPIITAATCGAMSGGESPTRRTQTWWSSYASVPMRSRETAGHFAWCVPVLGVRGTENDVRYFLTVDDASVAGTHRLDCTRRPGSNLWVRIDGASFSRYAATS